ncbi:MAG TPA: M6 family metalloprotease domain-containing protein [Gemmatimonadales bacterium]
MPYTCRLLVLLAATAVLGPRPAGGQQLTPDQIAWLRGHARDPEMGGGWARRAAQVRAQREALARTGQLTGLTPPAAARSGAALSGRLIVPLVAVTYPDVTPPFPVATLADAIFGTGGGPDTVTLAEYYAEVSNGLLSIEGLVTDWLTLDSAAAYYLTTAEYGWPNRGRFSEWGASVMARADAAVDFSAFDNDGPDGVPNSGDDDGVVDLLLIMYATDCGGEWRNGFIWPGGGSLYYSTTDPSARGGMMVTGPVAFQGAQRFSVCAPAYAGVVTHETGHAFGLPDLYDYDFSSQGIGWWGLMGYGLYQTEYAPAYLSAWSREQLGWVTVQDAATVARLSPTELSHVVLRANLPGSREYFLMENRRRIGTDAHLPGQGLLIWHVDPGVFAMTDETHKLVDLEEADGGDLDGSSFGDGGDPFPGTIHTSFGPGTIPGSERYDGRHSGLLVEEIVVHPGGDVGLTVLAPLGGDTVVAGLAGEAGSGRGYAVLLESGERMLWVRLSGGTGDADLSVQPVPALPGAGCERTAVGSVDDCIMVAPAGGVWRVVVRGATAYAGASLAVRTSHPGAVLALAPVALADTVLTGEADRTASVTVQNVGGSQLAWQLGAIPTGLAPAETSGTLAPLASDAVRVAFDPATLAPGTYDLGLAFGGNAANGTVTLPVSLTVVAAFTTAEFAGALLGGPALPPDQAAYADGRGNANGGVDLGDLVAWLDGTAARAPGAAAVHRRTGGQR